MHAALHTNQPIELPPGGLASFLTAETGSWADEDETPTGVTALKEVADKLAEYGRWEDTYLVHAAEGETVIPMAVLDGNPRLKEDLFQQMRDMGADPEQYIVGNELNSINPVTGQPEFSWFSKTWRKLKKAAKKVFKVVVPMVVQAVLTPILGPIGASAATGYLNAKYYGASDKDAWKQAGVAALFTGVAKGAQGVKEGVGFKEGVKKGFTGRTTYGSVKDARPSELSKLMGATDTPNAGYFQAGTPAAAIADSLTGQSAAQGVAPVVDQSAPLGTTQAGKQPSGATTFAGRGPADLDTRPFGTATQGGEGFKIGDITQDFTETGPLPDPLGQPVEGFKIGDITQDFTETGPLPDPLGRSTVGAETTYLGNDPVETLTNLEGLAQEATTPRLGERFTNIFTKEGEGFLSDLRDFVLPRSRETEMQKWAVADKIGVEEANKLSIPGLEREFRKWYPEGLTSTLTHGKTVPFYDKWAVPAGVGLAAMSLTGEEEEGVPEWYDTRSGQDVFRSDPARYGFGYGTYGPYSGLAQGGEAFPRRTGSIAGPGTGTSDDIPAMLSDGEFVMTAQAVRGAGNGSRRQGMRKMYDLMRNFEGAA